MTVASVRAREQITGIVGGQIVAATDVPARKFSEPEARRVVDYIHSNIDRELSLVDLAQLAKISPRQFVRIFSNTFGTTPHRYILNERVAQAKELIAKGLVLTDIAANLGFASQSHFNVVFRKVTGLPPGQFRQAARGCRGPAEPPRAYSKAS